MMDERESIMPGKHTDALDQNADGWLAAARPGRIGVEWHMHHVVGFAVGSCIRCPCPTP